HENPAFRFDAEVRGAQVSWCPYPGVPGVAAISSGEYHHQPEWYRNFLYEEERARGLDATEDLASPGVFRFRLGHVGCEAILASGAGSTLDLDCGRAAWLAAHRTAERQRRRSFASRLQRSADAYLVRRGDGQTIVAGYPWFTDWGRDTFIALRG